MRLDSTIFQLKGLKELRIDPLPLEKAIRRIEELTVGWDAGGHLTSSNLLNDLRRRIRAGMAAGADFDKYTDVKRREWLLISLYLNDLGGEKERKQLPPFDKKVASSILREEPEHLRKHLRRLATQLYFTHFDIERLPCLEWLSKYLKRAWNAADVVSLDPAAAAWATNADPLFGVDAPQKVAGFWKPRVSVEEIANQFFIHEGGLFRERLYEALILTRLKRVSLQKPDAELDALVLSEKSRILMNGNRLGAEALKILISRVKSEEKGVVPNGWREQLVTYGCDPRIPNKDSQAMWWGWATAKDRDIAIRALSELLILEFIKLLGASLRGTGAEHQFPKRRDLLLKLFNHGKVIEAKLVLHEELYRRMRPAEKQVLRPSWVSGGPQHTSVICLRCTDDVFLIEGTHNFGLRGFIGMDEFPISGFWMSAPMRYEDRRFRVSENSCEIYQRHHTGDWVGDFVAQLRSYRIEWGQI